MRISPENTAWEVVRNAVGAGWFMNRFLYLFGGELEQFQPCLDAWSFLVPPNHPDLIIIGKNAYGALPVLENGNGGNESAHLLDPLNVQYWTHSEIVLVNLFGNYLPLLQAARILAHDSEWTAVATALDQIAESVSRVGE